jgi:hypothetical protein
VAEPERAGGRGWAARGAVFAGLLLWPLVCLAHACTVVWLYGNLGKGIFLLLLLPLVLTALILAGVTVLLWAVTETEECGRDAAAVWGVLGLLLAYVFAYPSAAEWMLRWQGTETTCTVLGVDERLDVILTPVESVVDTTVTRYDYELDCARDGMPAEVTTDTEDLTVGERVAVVYDPSAAWGSWGADTAEELAGKHDVMVATGGTVAVGTGVWTLVVLGCAAADARAHVRARRRAPGGPARTDS